MLLRPAAFRYCSEVICTAAATQGIMTIVDPLFTKGNDWISFGMLATPILQGGRELH